jgi:hypothetical protein
VASVVVLKMVMSAILCIGVAPIARFPSGRTDPHWPLHDTFILSPPA